LPPHVPAKENKEWQNFENLRDTLQAQYIFERLRTCCLEVGKKLVEQDQKSQAKLSDNERQVQEQLPRLEKAKKNLGKFKAVQMLLHIFSNLNWEAATGSHLDHQELSKKKEHNVQGVEKPKKVGALEQHGGELERGNQEIKASTTSTTKANAPSPTGTRYKLEEWKESTYWTS